MVNVLEENDRKILVKIGFLYSIFYILYLENFLYVLKRPVITTQPSNFNNKLFFHSNQKF